MEFTPHTDRSPERKVDRKRTSLVLNHVRSFGITNAKIAQMLGVKESRISEGARPSDGEKKGWQLTEAECNYLTAEYGEPLREPGELMKAQVISMTGKSAFELTACILGKVSVDKLPLIERLLGECGYRTEVRRILDASFEEPHSFEQWYHGDALMQWLKTYLPLDSSPAALPKDRREQAAQAFLETLQAQGYTKELRGNNYDVFLRSELHLLMVLATFRVLLTDYKSDADSALTVLTDRSKWKADKTELVMTADCVWSCERLFCERLDVVTLLAESLKCIETRINSWASGELACSPEVSRFWRELTPSQDLCFSVRLFISKTNHYHLLVEKLDGSNDTLLLSDIKPAAFFGLIEFMSGGRYGLQEGDLWDIRKHIAASGGYLPGVTVVD